MKSLSPTHLCKLRFCYLEHIGAAALLVDDVNLPNEVVSGLEGNSEEFKCKDFTYLASVSNNDNSVEC